MNLRYVALYMDHDSGYKDPFRDDFNLNARFVSNYLSVQVRKLKLKTDGTFNMVSVVPSVDFQGVCRIVGDSSLEARVPFDKESYALMDESQRYEYYLKLLANGYKICARQKEIYVQHLLELHRLFAESGYRNEWIHKRKRFKASGLDVTLKCYFTSFDFKLQMLVQDYSGTREIVSGIVLRTRPDEVCFANLFKDVEVDGDWLVITESQNRPKFRFLLSDIQAGKFCLETTDEGMNYQRYEG